MLAVPGRAPEDGDGKEPASPGGVMPIHPRSTPLTPRFAELRSPGSSRLLGSIEGPGNWLMLRSEGKMRTPRLWGADRFPPDL